MLNLKTLRQRNVWRSETAFGHKLTDWSPAEWSNAMAGEAGEAANVTKKMLRGDYGKLDPFDGLPQDRACVTDLANEIADVIIYADLLAARCGIDLSEAIIQKFNAVSAKKGSAITLDHE